VKPPPPFPADDDLAVGKEWHRDEDNEAQGESPGREPCKERHERMIRLDKQSLRPYIILGIVAVLLYLFFVYVSPLLLPFLLALALAVLVDRPVRWLESRRVPRSLAIALVLGVVLLLLAVLLVIGMATLTVEVAQL